MIDENNIKHDNGYGATGNMVHYVLLKGLTGDVEKEYRDNLRKKNPIAYDEYLEYEKRMDKGITD